MEPVAFQGGDGKMFQTFVLNYLRYGDWLQISAVNPLQGAFSPQFPINTWLNPGYVVFRWLDWGPALVASLAVAFLALAVPTYLVGRAAGLGPVAAAVAAQAAVVTLPPFLFLFGLNSQYSLVPPGAVSVGLQTLALLVMLRLRSFTALGTLLSAILVAAVTSTALIADPTWSLPSLLAMLPFIAVIVFEGRRPSLVGARVAALVGALIVLYTIGLVDFVAAFVRFTARHVFDAEVARAQLPTAVSMLFVRPITFGRTMLWLATGWILGVALTRGARRLLAIACIVQWGLVLVLGAVYVFEARVAMSLSPIYIEQAAYHLYFLGAVSGWSALVERIGVTLATWWPRRPGRPVHGTLFGLLLVPAALALYLSEAVPMNRSRYTEPWAEEDCLVETFRPLVLAAGEQHRQFRGSVAVLEGGDGYGKVQTLARLWRDGIPTVNEYSQLVTPPFYYMTSRLLGSGATNQVLVLKDDSRIPALLGARFMAIPEPRIVTGWRRQCDGLDVARRAIRWSVVEIAEPNVGQYSPTEVRRAPTAAGMLAVMTSQEMDPRKIAVLAPDISVPPLTPARQMKLSIERGRLRVSGESDADSLVVLPVQYSRCWRIVGNESARLVRADLALTGLLFKHRIDADIVHDFGLFSSACRKTDYEDLQPLSLGPEPDYRLTEAQRHPLAVRTLDQVPARLGTIAQDISRFAELDRANAVLFYGPITRFVRRWFWGPS